MNKFFFAMALAMSLVPLSYASVDEELIDAAGKGCLVCVKDLINKGANVNFKDEFSRTPLLRTIGFQNDFSQEKLDIIKVLLKHGARINEVNDDQHNALTLAVDRGVNPEIALYLIEKGIKVQDISYNGILGNAIIWSQNDIKYIDVANKIIDKKVSLFTVASNMDFGWRYKGYPLVLAMRSEALNPIALRLIDLKANVNSGKKLLDVPREFGNGLDPFHFAPIHWTAIYNNTSMLKELIKRDVIIDAKTDGVTALMLAAKYGNLEIVKILLEANADKMIKDQQGLTAYDHAIKEGYADIANLLN